MVRAKGHQSKGSTDDIDIKSFLTTHGIVHRQLRRNHERSYYYVGLKLKRDLRSQQNTFSTLNRNILSIQII